MTAAHGAEAGAAADIVVNEVVEAAVSAGEPGRATDAPAGAGKTAAVVRIVAAQAGAGVNVGVVTQTNEQAFDVVDRIARQHPSLEVSFMHATGIVLPPATASLPNVRAITAAQALQAQIVVATGDKWAWSRDDVPPGSFGAGVVDEAYQMLSGKLLRVSDAFVTLDLVGDPGQLDPFSIADDEPWAGNPNNPVLNAVNAVLLNHPDLPRRALPITRRLPANAVEVVREAFYPQLDFAAATEHGVRWLEFTAAAGPRAAKMRDLWDVGLVEGWAFLQLPPAFTQQIDGHLVESLTEAVDHLLSRGPIIHDERDPGGRVLRPERVAVGVSHRNQRAAVKIALQRRGHPDVVVDTANRLQGREFDITVVWHPLSGRTDASSFHLDSGRLCVLTTRHRLACIVVGRAGIETVLEGHPPPSRVQLGVDGDPEYDGWEAHVRVLRHLRDVKIVA